MNGFIIFYSIWAGICLLCLILVEEASAYLSKEWKIKDIVQAIVLFPITIIILFVNLIFYLIEKFEKTKILQAVYKFLDKPVRKGGAEDDR